MNITEKIEGAANVLIVEGRLDTTTAPALEAKIKSLEGTAKDLILDLATLEYVSSAGLRVLLGAQKYYNSIKGSMVLRNVNKDIMEVLELTGFIDILTIE
ncbi:MAG: STAS domain-containing protein [Lachnospiraceae bacterium]|nr:STAS domain-containing protein [Lachnospiraceae bacterium]